MKTTHIIPGHNRAKSWLQKQNRLNEAWAIYCLAPTFNGKHDCCRYIPKSVRKFAQFIWENMNHNEQGMQIKSDDIICLK